MALISHLDTYQNYSNFFDNGHARSWKGNRLRIILLGIKFFSVFLLELTEKVKENLMIHLAIMLLACAISVFCHEHN